MKIESAAAYRYIKTYAATANNVASTGATGALAKQEATKTDQLHISGEAISRGELGRLTQTIAAELFTGVSSSRLQELQQQVASGDYSVATETLADNILGMMG